MINTTNNTNTILLLLITLILMVPLAILNGYVFLTMWGWFITPVLGIAAPSLLLSTGIWFFIKYLAHFSSYVEDNRTQTEKFSSSLADATFVPLGTLLTGYLIHLLM